MNHAMGKKNKKHRIPKDFGHFMASGKNSCRKPERREIYLEGVILIFRCLSVSAVDLSKPMKGV